MTERMNNLLCVLFVVLHSLDQQVNSNKKDIDIIYW